MDKLGGLAASAGNALFKFNQNNKIKPEESIKEAQASGKKEDVKQAASDFEALLLSQMFKAMWKNVNETGLSDSKEENMYRDMFNDELAKEISKDKGIGVKEIIIKELEK